MQFSVISCPSCGTDGEPGIEFCVGARQGHACKTCSNDRARTWRSQNEGRAKTWRRERYERNIELARAYKRLHGCASCGEDNPVCLDFHHSNPETKSWSIATRMAGSKKETLMAEMEKCIVLCRNCHAKLHWGGE